MPHWWSLSNANSTVKLTTLEKRKKKKERKKLSAIVCHWRGQCSKINIGIEMSSDAIASELFMVKTKSVIFGVNAIIFAYCHFSTTTSTTTKKKKEVYFIKRVLWTCLSRVMYRAVFFHRFYFIFLLLSRFDSQMCMSFIYSKKYTFIFCATLSQNFQTAQIVQQQLWCAFLLYFNVNFNFVWVLFPSLYLSPFLSCTGF